MFNSISTIRTVLATLALALAAPMPSHAQTAPNTGSLYDRHDEAIEFGHDFEAALDAQAQAIVSARNEVFGLLNKYPLDPAKLTQAVDRLRQTTEATDLIDEGIRAKFPDNWLRVYPPSDDSEHSQALRKELLADRARFYSQHQPLVDEIRKQLGERVDMLLNDTGHYDDSHSFGWNHTPNQTPVDELDTGHYDDGHGFGWNHSDEKQPKPVADADHGDKKSEKKPDEPRKSADEGGAKSPTGPIGLNRDSGNRAVGNERHARAATLENRNIKQALASRSHGTHAMNNAANAKQPSSVSRSATAAIANAIRTGGMHIGGTGGMPVSRMGGMRMGGMGGMHMGGMSGMRMGGMGGFARR